MKWTPEMLDDLRARLGGKPGSDYPPISKHRLAEMLGVRPGAISRWYSGCQPSQRSLEKLAHLSSPQLSCSF